MYEIILSGLDCMDIRCYSSQYTSVRLTEPLCMKAAVRIRKGAYPDCAVYASQVWIFRSNRKERSHL